MARRALGLRARGARRLTFEINGRPRQNPAYRPARLSCFTVADATANGADAAVPTGTCPSHSKLTFAYQSTLSRFSSEFQAPVGTSLTSLGEPAGQKEKYKKNRPSGRFLHTWEIFSAD